MFLLFTIECVSVFSEHFVHVDSEKVPFFSPGHVNIFFLPLFHSGVEFSQLLVKKLGTITINKDFFLTASNLLQWFCLCFSFCPNVHFPSVHLANCLTALLIPVSTNSDISYVVQVSKSITKKKIPYNHLPLWCGDFTEVLLRVYYSKFFIKVRNL